MHDYSAGVRFTKGAQVLLCDNNLVSTVLKITTTLGRQASVATPTTAVDFYSSVYLFSESAVTYDGPLVIHICCYTTCGSG